MLTKIIVNKIMDSLSKYISIDTESDFKLEIWQGKLQMNEITIRKQTLGKLELNGTIGQLKLLIPWSRIFSGYIDFSISNITLCISESVEEPFKNESLTVKEETKSTGLSFFERKLLERTLVSIKNLTIKYKNYVFKIHSAELNEEKHLKISDVEVYYYNNHRKCKLIHRFNLSGRIIDNIVNIYTNSIHLNLFMSHMYQLSSDLIHFESLMKIETKKDETTLVNESVAQTELQDFLESNKQNKIVDSDKKIQLRIAIDTILISLYKNSREIVAENRFHIELSETFLNISEKIHFTTQITSHHLSGNIFFKDSFIGIENVYFNSSKFLEKLNGQSFVKSHISLDQLNIFGNSLDLENFVVCVNGQKFLIDAVEVITDKKEITVKNINNETARPVLIHLFRSFFDFYEDLGIDKAIQKEHPNQDQNSLSTVQNASIKVMNYISSDNIEFTDLNFNLTDIFPQKDESKVNIESAMENSLNINESTKYLEISAKKAQIFGKTVENFHHILNLNKIFPIEEVDFHIGKLIGISAITENEQQKGVEVEKIHFTPHSFAEKLSITGDYLNCELLRADYNLDLVSNILILKDYVYSCLRSIPPAHLNEDKSKIDFKINFKRIIYFHRLEVEVVDLVFENEKLDLICKSGELKIQVNCDFEADDLNKINLKVTGIVEPEQYRLMIMSLVEFITILQKILKNPFEKPKDNSTPLILETEADLSISDLICNIENHCENDLYHLRSSVHTRIHGSLIEISSAIGSVNKRKQKDKYLTIKNIKCTIEDIPFGFKVDMYSPVIDTTFGVHELLILKEKIITPKFDMIGTAVNLRIAVILDQILVNNVHEYLPTVQLKDFSMVQKKMKFLAEFDDVSTTVLIKIDEDIANTISISSNNVVAAKHISFIQKYRELVQFFMNEADTGFIAAKATHFNFLLKDSEFFFGKHELGYSDSLKLSESVPFIKLEISKLIFFIPGTSSIKYSVSIFNPRTLIFDILIEPSTLIITKLGEKFNFSVKQLNINIQKETFKAFSSNNQRFFLQIENIMKDMNVSLKASAFKEYSLNDTERVLDLDLLQEDESTGPVKSPKETILTPSSGLLALKPIHSHKQTFFVNEKMINLDLTLEKKYYWANYFVFCQILNFKRHIIFFNQVFFKNCLPYSLDLLLGDENDQEEPLKLEDELSFNTTHSFLRIESDFKVSAESFMFQKGVFKGDRVDMTLFLDQKMIQISDKVINISSYVQNIAGNLIYYVFFTPHSFIVNKSNQTQNFDLNSPYKSKIFALEPDEIIINDCFSFKDQLYLKKIPKIQSDKNDSVDYIITNRKSRNLANLYFREKNLSLNVYGNHFPIIKLIIIAQHFKVLNQIDQPVTIDKIKIPKCDILMYEKNEFEMAIDFGVVSVDSKTKIFDFNVMNILKEFSHKYLFSMEKRDVKIDLGDKLQILDTLNVSDQRTITFGQKHIEILYSFIIENQIGMDIKVNGVFINQNEKKPITMKNKNIMKINNKEIHLLKSPYFKLNDNFFTVISSIDRKQKIMKLCPCLPPIVIYNNLDSSTICANKKYYIEPGQNLPFAHEEFEEMSITIEFNQNGKSRKIRRKVGQSVQMFSVEVSSVQRGMREYIYVGSAPKLAHFLESLNLNVDFIVLSLFEEGKEFINLYVRELNLLRKEDSLGTNSSISVTVKGFQVDNQEHSPIFPIILNPVFPQFYFYNKNVVENQFFFCFTCEFNQKNLFKETEDRLIDYAFCAIHEFELNLEEDIIEKLVDWLPRNEGATKTFFQLLHISPINLRLSLHLSKKKKIFQKLAGFLASNMSEVRLSFKSLIFIQFGFNKDLIVNAYKMQLLSQIFSIIGGLDILGNLSSLTEELSMGVHDLIYEPFVGLKEDDLLQFTTGILKGGRNFATYFLKGITGTISKFGKSISKSSSKKNILFYDDLRVDISKDFLENVVDGLSGIITKPVLGAKKKGFKGFLKGIGSGLSGAITKPIAGFSDFAANINEDLKSSIHGIELRRIRYPRPNLEIYDLYRSQAFFLFQIFKNRTLQPISSSSKRLSVTNEEFIDGSIGTIYDIEVHLILTDKRLVLMSREANIHVDSFTIISDGIKADQWTINVNEPFLSLLRDNLSNITVE